MNLGIKNKRVLISGASNGIGKELAYQFAKEGCKLTLLARNKAKLQHIINEIGGKNKGHYFFDINLLPNGNATKISKKILEALKEIVKDPVEYKMIVQLLKKEKRFSTKEDTRLIKKEFQLSINQYFPMEENNE